MKNQPNTWNELLDAGYVSELTEKQVADFKRVMKPKLKDLKKKAHDFGTRAFKTGMKAIPHHDVEFNKFLNTEVPANRRLLMYKTWASAWHRLNAASMEGF